MGQVLSIDQADYPVPAGAALQENADWTLGPLFVGWASNVFLCGVTVSWASTYWVRARGDKPLVKAAVVVAVVFECLCAITNLWSLVDHGKDQDRTNNAISLLIGPDALSVTLGTVVAVAVQSFFGIRCVRALPRKWRPPFILWTWGLIGASFGGSLGITAIEFINKGATDVSRGASPDAYHNLYLLALTWLFCGMAVDVSISLVLIGRLWVKARAASSNEGKSDGGLPLRSSVDGFMRLTFEAALATAITSLAAGVTYVTLTETTNVSYALSNVLPGLYACSLLWVLNSAHRLAAEIDLAKLNSIQLVWNLGPAMTGAGGGSQRRQQQQSESISLELGAPRLAQIVTGPSRTGTTTSTGAMDGDASTEGTWELKRGLASAKARQRLGEDVHVVSFQRQLPPGEGPASPRRVESWGRGSTDSFFCAGNSSEDKLPR